MIKWALRFIGFLMIVIAATALYIEFNKDKLVKKAVDAINNGLTTPISYESSDVAFLSTFPNISLKLNQMSIHDQLMDEPPLISMGLLAIKLNVTDALRSTEAYEINDIIMSDGVITLIDRADGSNNYMITSDAPSEETAPTNVVLNHYTISNIDLTHIDLKSKSENNIKSVSSKGDIKYLNNNIALGLDMMAILDIGILNDQLNLKTDGAITIEEEFSKIALTDLDVYLNDLPLTVNGTALIDDVVQYDFEFVSPETEVKKLLSLVNTVYTNKYAQLKSTGSYDVKGSIQGHSNHSYPIYKVALNIKDGTMNYPGLSNQIDKLNLDISINNTARNKPFTDVIIQGINLRSDDNFLTGSGLINHTDVGYSVDLQSKMNADFSSLSKAFELGPDTELSGTGTYDMGIKTVFDQSLGLIGGNDPVFQVDGQFDDINFISEDGQYQLDQITINGDQSALSVDISDMNMDDYKGINVELQLEQPLSMMDFNRTTNGSSVVDIEQVTISSDSNVESFENVNNYRVPSIAIGSTINISKVEYDDYIIDELEINGILTDHLSPVDVSIKSLNGNALQIKGDVSNLIQYGLNNDTLTGQLKIIGDRLDLNSLLTEEEEEATEVTQLLPTNLDLDITYDIPELRFYNIDISKALGDVTLHDGKVNFSQDANILDGHITFSGGYEDYINDTAQVELNVDLNAISFESTASQLGFFNKLIPFSQYLEGDYSGTLQWKSKIDKNYIPDLNSLSAFGEIQTQNGAINGFAPLDTFMSFIKTPIKENRWYLDNLKRYFLIEDGRFIIKEIAVKKDDITLTYNGSHSFEQEIDYDVRLSLPKSLLDMDGVMNILSKAGGLHKKLNGFGDDIIVNIDAHVSGKLTRPKLSLKDISMSKGGVTESIKEAIKQTAEDKIEEVETTVVDTVNYIKDAVIDSINTIKDQVIAQKDSIQDIFMNELDSSKVDVASQVNDLIDSLATGSLDSLPGALEDIFKGQKDRISDLKDKIKIDIFKKKKGN